MPPKEITITFDDEELTEIESSDDEEGEPLAPAAATTPHRPSEPTASTSSVTVVPARAKSTRPSTQNATERSRARRGLPTLVAPLRAYRTTTYPTSSLNEWMEQGSDCLDLDADYQRGVVWNDAKQMGLIDSIFRNYYIPPIVFTTVATAEGGEKRICIDGKQRLTSIRRFFQGEIYYKDPATNVKMYYKCPPGSKRPKLLPIQEQSKFRNKQMACCEYDSVTPEQEREIFQRVQLGMALGPTDRLPAINGPFADLVRDLRRRFESTEGFGNFQSDSRGKDFQALAQIVYLIEHGTGKNSEPTSARIEAFLAKGGEDVGPLQEKANLVMDSFVRIIQDPVLARPLLERELVPLEFVMAVYLVHLHRTALSGAQLSEAIHHMRQHWKKSDENKFNTKAFKDMLNFVQKQVPKLKLKARHYATDSDVPMAEVIKGRVKKVQSKPVAAAPAPATKRATKTPVKRKLDEVDDDESDCDIIVVPSKKKSIAKQKQETMTPALETEEPQAIAPRATPQTLKSKLESRTASTSKAKTTIKKSPAKRPRTVSTPVTPYAFSAKTQTVVEQVTTPSVKPVQRMQTTMAEPSTSHINLKGLARASSTVSTASTSTSRPAMTARPPISSSSNHPLALPGRSTPSASPHIPTTILQYAASRSFLTNDIASASAGPSAPLSVSTSALDRLAPLRAAKEAAERKRGSMSGTASAPSTLDLAGHADAPAHPASTVSTAPQDCLKNLKFTKKLSPTAAAILPVALVVNSMNASANAEDSWNFGSIVGTSTASSSAGRSPAIPRPATMAPTAEIRVPVQTSPSTDPRLRMKRKASGTGEFTNKLPTPVASPQILAQNLQRSIPGGADVDDASRLRTAAMVRQPVESETALQPPPPPKRSRPSVQPPYPVPGTQRDDRHNR